MEPVLTIPFFRNSHALLSDDYRVLICTQGAMAHEIPTDSAGKLLFYRRAVLGTQRIHIEHKGSWEDPNFMRTHVFFKTRLSQHQTFLGLTTALQEALLKAKLIGHETGTYTYYMKVVLN